STCLVRVAHLLRPAAVLALTSCFSSFWFQSSGAPRDLHSFPTRRSSDLAELRRALPAQLRSGGSPQGTDRRAPAADRPPPAGLRDRKSTRLNSSHVKISYAVFCLKKKKKTNSPVDSYATPCKQPPFRDIR